MFSLNTTSKRKLGIYYSAQEACENGLFASRSNPEQLYWVDNEDTDWLFARIKRGVVYYKVNRHEEQIIRNCVDNILGILANRFNNGYSYDSLKLQEYKGKQILSVTGDHPRTWDFDEFLGNAYNRKVFLPLFETILSSCKLVLAGCDVKSIYVPDTHFVLSGGVFYYNEEPGEYGIIIGE